MPDFVNDLGRCTGKRVPASRQHGGHAELVGSESAKELHSKDLAERSAGEADPGEREVFFGLREEVRAHHEACIDNSQVVQFRVLEYQWPDDGEVNVRSSQLAAEPSVNVRA